MEVQRLPFYLVDKTPYGEVKKRHGHDKVIVNGRLAGYVPIEGEPSEGVFHPLSGFPQSMVKDVEEALELKGSLDAPVPHQPDNEDDDE